MHQKWSKLKALILFGFAASVMTTFSDEIANLSNEINTQIKDLVGLDLHENGIIINILTHYNNLFFSKSDLGANRKRFI